MMKTRFIMIRHGFSEANKSRKFAGHADFPLTDIGQRQAELVSEALRDERIDAVYASDISRAYDTAKPVAESHSLEIVIHKGLREIYAGEWEGLAFDALEEKYAESFGIWKSDLGRAHPDGGESIAQLFARVIATLGEIAAENPEKTVCIATHATPVRAVTVASIGGTAADMSRVNWTPNASISVFDYEDGKFSAVELNRVDHLGDLCTKLPTNV